MVPLNAAEAHTLDKILQVASLIQSGQQLRLSENLPLFPFLHPQAHDIVTTALRVNGIDYPKIRLEFHSDLGQVRFNMSEGTVHSNLTTKFASAFLAVARKAFPTSTPVALQKSSAGRKPAYTPDASWAPDRSVPTASTVLEVGVSQTRKQVDRKCNEYILGNGHVCSAIATKIWQRSTSPTTHEEVLDHLDRCYVGL
ncbi:hypothetical protein ColLi_09159 [Colletotrichum liriopes]|uniref:Uncharacterized protein n=1 Tax=Colletotrichum liriopes TaxID=708192 RepID=A0AA37LW25_9PEZI|nr:hypothetical protein ColLi_09159 [Colletotrichum liriopes]